MKKTNLKILGVFYIIIIFWNRFLRNRFPRTRYIEFLSYRYFITIFIIFIMLILLLFSIKNIRKQSKRLVKKLENDNKAAYPYFKKLIDEKYNN